VKKEERKEGIYRGDWSSRAEVQQRPRVSKLRAKGLSDQRVKKEERKEGIYRGETMESIRAERKRREMKEYRGKRQRE
jgi:hypothetical protein